MNISEERGEPRITQIPRMEGMSAGESTESTPMIFSCWDFSRLFA